MRAAEYLAALALACLLAAGLRDTVNTVLTDAAEGLHRVALRVIR